MRIKKFTFPFTAFLADESEVEILVSAEITPASRGARDAFGCPMEPDEPAEIEIISAVGIDGKAFDCEVDFPKSEIDRMKEDAIEFY